MLNPRSATDIESRMPPLHQHADQVIRNIFLKKQHFKDLVPENLFREFWVKTRRNSESRNEI